MKCTKHQELMDLYSKKLFNSQNLQSLYEDGSLYNNPVSCFCCQYHTVCNVMKDEPIYTGMLGDCESDILIVGEAPSASDLKNDSTRAIMPFNCTCEDGGNFIHAHLGGYTRNIPKKGNLFEFIDFIRNSCVIPGTPPGPWPYFTDVIKCGLARQNAKDKRLLKVLRATRCAEYILAGEISIIKPRVIACAGKFAYGIVLELIRSGLIPQTTVLYFIHYSRNAQLSVTLSEKHAIVWPIQAGCTPKAAICAELGTIASIRELSEGPKNQTAQDAELEGEYEFEEDD